MEFSSTNQMSPNHECVIYVTERKNGHDEKDINKIISKHIKAMNPNIQPSQDEMGKRTFSNSPIKRTIDRVGRILNKYNIQTVFKSLKKTGQILRNPKDQKPPLSSAGVYKIPCSCGKVYIGETGRMVNIRMKEHQCDVRLKHVTQLVLSEHNIDTGHQILFDKTTTSHYYIIFPKKVQRGSSIKYYRDAEISII